MIIFIKAHPATQALSGAARPAELNEPGLRRNPGEPDAKQAEASTYNKPRIQWQGLTIAVENPAGSVRRGRNRHGVTWEVRMRFDYGEIVGTMGVDGDPVDVIVGPNLEAPTVYVVHQRRVNDWKNYDEDKVCVGFDSQSDAEAAFLSNYNDPRFLGPITAMPVEEFVTKVRATKEKPAMIKALFLKTHVDAYTKKDGTFVAAHEDKRQAQADHIHLFSGDGDDLVDLYHGTSHDGHEAIKKDGYIRGGSYYGVKGKAVALTPNRTMAEEYANGGPVIRVRVPRSSLVVDPESRDDDDLDSALREGASVYANADRLYIRGRGEMAKSTASLVLFLKARVGPYLRGGKMVNLAGYQGRAARAVAAPGQLSLFVKPSVDMSVNRYKDKHPVHDTRDLFEDTQQHNYSNLSNNEAMKKDLASLAQEFTSAYADDPRGVFMNVRDELRAIASDHSSFSVSAVEFLKKMDKEQQEAFVVEHVVPALRDAGWPKPHTKPMSDAVWSVAEKFWATKEPRHTEPTRELIAEHERLVDVLNSPSHADDKAEAKKQAAELKEYKEEAGEVPQAISYSDMTPEQRRAYDDRRGIRQSDRDRVSEKLHAMGVSSGDHDHLLADIPGAKWSRGKGLIDGHYGVKVGGDVVGNYHAKPEDAVAEAKRWLAGRAAAAEQKATIDAAMAAMRARIEGGGDVTEADLKLLGLRPGSSGLEWFIPSAAKLFGISSRAVRPHIKDLIRVGHTDMGVKKEFVEPKKALQAIAAAKAS